MAVAAPPYRRLSRAHSANWELPSQSSSADHLLGGLATKHSDDIQVEYKEVVVVGNGPSGIVLSFLLAGNWPYYSQANGLDGRGHPNEFLHCRLSAEPERSLVEQDLEFLSQDLEGRSSNPVALLFDALNHPEADLGLELPSMLEWKHHQNRAVDHVVLGQGPPGGAWQQMDGSVLTISLGCWMELPTVNFRQWELGQNARGLNSRESRASVSSVASYYSDYVKTRGLHPYFRDYACVTSVRPLSNPPAALEDGRPRKIVLELHPTPHCGLTKPRRRLRSSESDPFVQTTTKSDGESETPDPPTPTRSTPLTPTKVHRAPGWKKQRSSDFSLPATDPMEDIMLLGSSSDQELLEWCWRERYCKTEELEEHKLHPGGRSGTATHPSRPKEGLESTPLWEVRGFVSEGSAKREFCYVTPNVVLATGNTDLPNWLDIPGENLPFVLHSLRDLENLIANGTLDATSDPVMIVGAGLSAADAVIAARFHGVPVVHVFRRKVDDPNLIFNQLPENMYPEYHKVHQMMRDGGCGYEGYKPCAQHVVLDISPEHRIKVVGPWSCRQVRVSYLLVCIGSRPNLAFLPDCGRRLGVYPDTPIHCRYNPVDVDLFTHRCTRMPGFYALGPLVGENFVRFLQGGALAITNHLHRTWQERPHPVAVEARRVRE